MPPPSPKTPCVWSLRRVSSLSRSPQRHSPFLPQRWNLRHRSSVTVRTSSGRSLLILSTPLQVSRSAIRNAWHRNIAPGGISGLSLSILRYLQHKIGECVVCSQQRTAELYAPTTGMCSPASPKASTEHLLFAPLSAWQTAQAGD